MSDIDSSISSDQPPPGLPAAAAGRESRHAGHAGHAGYVSTTAPLFEGERIMRGAGVPVLTRFIKGDPARALVVFLPGSAHAARIAYGGHAGAAADDFLAHWLIEQGHNFLGVSYPIAMANPVDQAAHPGFSIRAWGRQAAEIAAEVVAENQLSGKIILVVWSNGGRSPQAFAEAATALGMEVDFCVSFSATPPNAAITILPPATLPPQMARLRTADGYIDLAPKYEEWYAQVQHNAAPGRDIIPRGVYLHDYVGAMPVNLLGQGMAHHEDGFVPGGWTFMEDSKGHDPAAFPLMTTIVTDNIVDSRHALTDQALWSPYLVGHLYAAYFEQHSLSAGKVAPEKWRTAVALLRAAPQRLSVDTTGNHFFFVGKAGARQAARDIAELEKRVHALRSELAGLLPTGR